MSQGSYIEVAPGQWQDRRECPPAPGAWPRPQPGKASAVCWLGAELRRLRLELGISQRRLTRLIGLSAHSNLGDYENGRRIPPGDIVVACERLLSVEPGYLQRLRRLALRERAAAHLRAPSPGRVATWPPARPETGDRWGTAVPRAGAVYARAGLSAPLRVPRP